MIRNNLEAFRLYRGLVHDKNFGLISFLNKNQHILLTTSYKRLDLKVFHFFVQETSTLNHCKDFKYWYFVWKSMFCSVCFLENFVLITTYFVTKWTSIFSINRFQILTFKIYIITKKNKQKQKYIIYISKRFDNFVPFWPSSETKSNFFFSCTVF